MGFHGNVLFEISLVHPLPSLVAISAVKREDEFVLSPYHRFTLRFVRWDCGLRRWILCVEEEEDLPEVRSWFGKRDATLVKLVE
jgi:hypothetical protein